MVPVVLAINSWDSLTEGRARLLFCEDGGICNLNSLIVGNLTVYDTFFNATVVNYNVTGTLDVDGNVIMCCRDYESKAKFGNVFKQDIKKIRNSKKYQDLLKKQLKYNFSTPICNTCDNSFDSSLDWIC